MSGKYNVAILGATGAVGEAMIDILQERKFPVKQLFPLASARSVGETVLFRNKNIPVLDVETFDFSQVNIGLFSAGASVSEKYGPIAADAGCVVIDNTSCFRYDDDIPLVVPEVNAKMIEQYRNRNIIANPNCSTIQLVVALKPIYDAVGISRINIATYQSVSGAGKKGVTELVEQTTQLLSGKVEEPKVFSRQIAFNVIPHIDNFQDNGYTREEMKLIWETRKILNDESIMINPTAVRVPVFYGHSEAVHIETKQKISAAEAKELLLRAPGIILLEENEDFPTAISEGSSQDAVYVGRVREDLSHPSGLNLWIVADNVRKGAALNAVQIAEILIGLEENAVGVV
jgi:aspartate-semialdehyde dehydrogenase